MSTQRPANPRPAATAATTRPSGRSATLGGYRGPRPARIGNGAHDQLQLDIRGELMGSVYLYNKRGAPIPYDLWTHLRRLAGWVCDNWRSPDEGTREVRGGGRHFVYSKLMCRVAPDRALGGGEAA